MKKAIAKEEWRDVLGYEGYMISNIGRIKSVRFGKLRIMKPALSNCGYFHVTLCSNKKYKTRTIHQMVAIAFLDHVPCGLKLVVNHINGIKTDNRVENLEIVTNRKNTERNSPKSVSKYVGVGFHKGTNKWRARIRINSKEKYLGLFDTELQASNAYQNELSKL